MTTKKSDDQGGASAFPPNLRLRPGLSRRPAIDAEIGKKMRAMYAELVEQPIPDRFVELLKQIDQAQENKSR